MGREEYSAVRKIRKGLVEGSEEVFTRLEKCLENGTHIPVEVLSSVIEHPKVSGPTKTLAIKMVVEALKAKEATKEAIGMVATIKFVFKAMELVKNDTETVIMLNQEHVPECTERVMELFSQMALSAATVQLKDRVVHVFIECGVFTLLNAWNGPDLLRVYAGVFHRESPSTTYPAPGAPPTVAPHDSTPYRMHVEEKIAGIGTVLAHRRIPSLFHPREVDMTRRKRPGMYEDILLFQDDYGILHGALAGWCNEKGDLKGVEWAVVWCIAHLAKHLEKDTTYEAEGLFLLGPSFHSVLINTLGAGTLEELELMGAYMHLINRGRESRHPTLRGVSAVASQRLTSQNSKFFMSVVNSPKSPLENKVVAVQCLAEQLKATTELEKAGVHKTIAKNAVALLEMLEVHPIGRAVEHRQSILSLLGALEEVPLALYRPNAIVLVYSEVAAKAEALAKKEKQWLRMYMKSLYSIYHTDTHDRILAGLGLG
ncbi:hypothetical protein NEDG_02067 [Nematocida displodere]|uniref:Uncharacterized protein n=1 Tax=Nematocida displodere TaxID=1805483 RepID=A0A177EKU1_9MICR|nr:hypothetical protein NEDG_02067 [Nematocida displodere]